MTPEQKLKKLQRVTEIDATSKKEFGLSKLVIELEDKIDNIEQKIDEIETQNISKSKLAKIIKPLIPSPEKGDDGKDYILTESDKLDIAQKITVPVVEKIVEKSEVIKEVPIVTNEIKEVAVTDTAEDIRNKLEVLQGDERLRIEAIRDLREELDFLKKIGGEHIVTTSNRGLYQLLDVNVSGVLDGQTIAWDGSQWIPATHLTNLDYIDFNTSATYTSQEGRLGWNSEDGTLQVGLPGGNVDLRMGQQVIRVKATEDISKGSAVYVSGASGQRATVTKAKADAEATSHGVIGVATESISQNQFGYITVAGIVRDIDTSDLTEGTQIYLSATETGKLVDSEPVGNFIVHMGTCIYSHETEGKILVQVDVVHNGDEIRLATVDGATYATVQQMQDIYHSTGLADGGLITDNGDGTYAVAAGSGYIRATNDATDTLLAFDFSANAGLTPDEGRNYVGVEYNAGSPQIVQRVSYDWDYQTDFPLGEVVKEGAVLHIFNAPQKVGDHAGKMIEAMEDTMPFARDERTGGLIIGETGTRRMTLTAGSLWYGLTEYDITAKNTTTDSMDTYYRDTPSGWVLGSTQQWNNTQYDDGSGTLQTMTAARYANNWFYVDVESGGTLIMVYPQAQYTTIAQAEAEAPPSSLPDRIASHGRIVGRLTFQYNAGTATSIDSVFESMLSFSGVTSHSSLANLDWASSGHTGTANHVPYFNGSNVAATSANFTYDGNTLFVSGSTNPMVQVGDSDYPAYFAKIGAVDQYPGIWFNQSTPSVTNYAFLYAGGTIFNTPSSTTMYFRVGNTNAMAIGPNRGLAFGATYYSTDPGTSNVIIEGTLGVGTTSASTKGHFTLTDSGTTTVPNVLTIEHLTTGTAANGLGATLSFKGEIADGTSTELTRITSLCYDVSSNRYTAMAFYTGSGGSLTEKMRIDRGGNVLIGATTATFVANKQVYVYEAGSAGYSFQNSVRQWSFFVQATTGNYGLYNHGATAYAFMIDGTNQVGIGTQSPGALLDVRGSAIFNEDGANVDFRIEGDTLANLFFLDASADKIGINQSGPASLLHIKETAKNNTGGFRIEDSDTTNAWNSYLDSVDNYVFQYNSTSKDAWIRPGFGVYGLGLYALSTGATEIGMIGATSNKLYFDLDLTYDDYWYQDTAGSLDFYSGGTKLFEIDGNGIGINGSFRANYNAESATYTIAANDYVIDCTNTFTATLPTAVGIAGKVYIIKNSNSGTVTVDTTSSQTIDGASSVSLGQYDSITVMSNGSNWIII